MRFHIVINIYTRFRIVINIYIYACLTFFSFGIIFIILFLKNFIFLIFQSNYNFEHTQWSLIWNLRGLVRRETRKRK